MNLFVLHINFSHKWFLALIIKEMKFSYIHSKFCIKYKDLGRIRVLFYTAYILMSHFIQLKIVRGVFKAKKGLTLFQSTELSLQSIRVPWYHLPQQNWCQNHFSSFHLSNTTQLAYKNRQKNVILYNPSKNSEHMHIICYPFVLPI